MRGDSGDDGHVVGPPDRLIPRHRPVGRHGRDRLGDLRTLSGLSRVGLTQVPGPPGGLVGNSRSQTGEPLRGEKCARLVQRGLAVAQTSEVLACRGPAVVDQDGPIGIECRRHRTEPAGAQLGIDGLHQGARGRCLIACISGNRDPIRQAQSGQDGSRSSGQHAILTSHGGGESIQGGGVHHRASGAAGSAGLGHGDAMSRGHILHGLVDQGVNGASTAHRRGGPQRGQVLAPHGSALASAQEQLGGDMGDPPLSQAPRTRHALGDARGTHARGAQEPAQASANGIGENRSVSLVAGGALCDSGGERRHVGIRGAIDAGELELSAHIHEQLVAS